MTNSPTTRPKVTIDGNEAAAYVAHQINEVIAIYPITPSSNMGEWADQWSAERQDQYLGHRADGDRDAKRRRRRRRAATALCRRVRSATTFTASQGLLLMIPNMYKIAGELTRTVFHIAARALAAQALSIFGDHSDVMAARSTGFGMLSSNSVQEVMDMALIAQAATLEARIPFLHFFDGFRTSHEVAKIEQLTADDMRAMIDDELVPPTAPARSPPTAPSSAAPRRTPTSTSRRAKPCNPYYLAAPDHRAERDGQVRRRSPAASTTCSITSARRMPSASSS